jgi:hypothetical protein
MYLMKNTTIPNYWLRKAEYCLARLAEIDFRYESFTSRLTMRGSPDSEERQHQLDQRQIRERAGLEQDFTAVHETISEIILEDLTSTEGVAPPR